MMDPNDVIVVSPVLIASGHSKSADLVVVPADMVFGPADLVFGSADLVLVPAVGGIPAKCFRSIVSLIE